MTVVIIICIVLAALIILIFLMNMGMKDVKNLTISDIDLSKIADGEYEGSLNKGRWTNTVRITVKDHKIEKIDVIKDMMAKSDDIRKKIENSVIEKQSLQIDAVSGATLHTKAYLKAIENALTKSE